MLVSYNFCKWESWLTTSLEAIKVNHYFTWIELILFNPFSPLPILSFPIIELWSYIILFSNFKLWLKSPDQWGSSKLVLHFTESNGSQTNVSLDNQKYPKYLLEHIVLAPYPQSLI